MTPTYTTKITHDSSTHTSSTDTGAEDNGKKFLPGMVCLYDGHMGGGGLVNPSWSYIVKYIIGQV